VDEQQRTALERERPVDLARFTWAAWIDAVLAIVAGFVIITITLSVYSDGFFLFGLSFVAGLYSAGAWRAHRMAAGLTLIEQDAAHGRFSSVVRIRAGSTFGRARAGTLVVADGWVNLQGTVQEQWPASSVTLGRPPSWMTSKGIELLTPSGPRFVGTVRYGDPAMAMSIPLDRRAREALGRALATQRAGMASALNQAGWYPDPAGSAAWRWWDGQQWGPLSNQR
jgi:hypothetical protein